MKQEDFEELYNKILDVVEDWDYSDLDRLLDLSKQDGFIAGRESFQKQVNTRVRLAQERVDKGQNVEVNQAIIDTLTSLIV